MSDIHAFNQGANILAFEKNNIKYAATYAWATQVGYEEVAILQGEQSDTAKAIAIGDIVGISALKEGQEALAMHIGSTHSTQTNKFEHIPYIQKGTAIIIPDAKVTMICECIDIIHLKGAEDDYFTVFKILESTDNPEVSFLYGYFYD